VSSADAPAADAPAADAPAADAPSALAPSAHFGVDEPEPVPLPPLLPDELLDAPLSALAGAGAAGAAAPASEDDEEADDDDLLSLLPFGFGCDEYASAYQPPPLRMKFPPEI
jgi:hypothetical protein